MITLNVLRLLISLGFPPCEYEDSNNCYWDAQHMGNGDGRSFIVIDNDVLILTD